MILLAKSKNATQFKFVKIVLSTNIIRSLAVPAPLIFIGIWLIFSQVNVVLAQSQQGREEQNIQLEQNTRYSEYEVKEGETLYMYWEPKSRSEMGFNNFLSTNIYFKSIH